MNEQRPAIQYLLEELQLLPGIGPKSAQRIAYGILRKTGAEIERLAQAVLAVKERIVSCHICNNLTESDPCAICSDPTRDSHTLCVVETPFNILTIEKSGGFRGQYHVLHGRLAPLSGIGPEQLQTSNLYARLESHLITEVIIATNPNLEGDATALFLAQKIKPTGVRVTRIAMGLPVGSDIEYADQVTITRAISGRQEL
jgi:recombination protein RecR